MGVTSEHAEWYSSSYGYEPRDGEPIEPADDHDRPSLRFLEKRLALEELKVSQRDALLDQVVKDCDTHLPHEEIAAAVEYGRSAF